MVVRGVGAPRLLAVRGHIALTRIGWQAGLGADPLNRRNTGQRSFPGVTRCR